MRATDDVAGEVLRRAVWLQAVPEGGDQVGGCCHSFGNHAVNVSPHQLFNKAHRTWRVLFVSSTRGDRKRGGHGFLK